MGFNFEHLSLWDISLVCEVWIVLLKICTYFVSVFTNWDNLETGIVFEFKIRLFERFNWLFAFWIRSWILSTL